MKRWSWIVILTLVACGKKESSEQPSGKPAQSASAAPEASAAPPKKASAKVKGSYTAKQGEVRMPADAPPFIHPESKDGIGNGELELTLPGDRGEVTGKATGALGTQVFSGFLDQGKLTGTLHPAEGSSPMMWGLVDATVEGGSVKGTIRASGSDGRVVREASFTLDKS